MTIHEYLTKNSFRLFRAKVIDNKDPEKLGRVKVWIPDFMYDMEELDGIWALPANQLFGGSIESNLHSGQSIIPNINDWIWVFFENDDFTHCFYFTSVKLINNARPPETLIGNEYYNNYLLFRSPKGRVVLISDDESTPLAGVYLTGKKRLYDGNNAIETSFTIYRNQSIISIWEREKDRILLADYYKNYFSINTSDSKIYLYGSSINSNSEINIFNDKSAIQLQDDDNQGKIIIQNKQCIITIEDGNIHIDANQSVSLTINNAEIKLSNDNIKIQTSGSVIELSDGQITLYANSKIVLQAPLIEENPGISKSPSPDSTKSPIAINHDDIPWE